MSQHLIGEIAYSPRITVQSCSEVVDGGGAGHLEWIDVRDTTSERVTRREAKGLFLLLGAEPHCDRLPPDIAREPRLRPHRPRPPHRALDRPAHPPENLATTVPGVFAAGDIRARSMKRVASASGEGASVVPLAHSYLAPNP